MVPVMVAVFASAKIIFASPVLSSKTMVAVTSSLKVAVLSSFAWLPPAIVKVVAVTPVEPVKVALPACVVEPMLIVSAATAAPEKVTSDGAVSAVANNTLISLLVLVSVILPATVIAPVYEIVKLLEPFKAIVVAVIASLKVAVILSATLIFVALTAALKILVPSISIKVKA